MIETSLHQTGREFLAVLTSDRRSVDPDGHRQARLVDRNDWKRSRVFEIGKSFANGDFTNTSDRDDFTRTSLRGVDAIERFGHIQLADLGPLDRAVAPTPRNRFALTNGAVPHSTQREPPNIRRRIEVGNQRLEWMIDFVRGGWHVAHQEFEQRREILTRFVDVQRGRTGTRVAIHDRKFDLVFIGI